MTKEEKEAVLHCLRSMIDEELCEECPLYGTTGTDHCEKDCVRLAIEELEQEPCEDCISRQAVIDALNKTSGIRGDALKALYDLPSVTSKGKTEWIPVSKRMPEEHEWIGTKRFGTTKSDEVYVTFETPKGERFTKHLSFQNGKLSMADQQTINVIYKGSVPVAWMPLPEPYKAEGSD